MKGMRQIVRNAVLMLVVVFCRSTVATRTRLSRSTRLQSPAFACFSDYQSPRGQDLSAPCRIHNSFRSLHADTRRIFKRFMSFESETNLITSTQSTTVKRIKMLLQKRKKRTEMGQTVVEGPKIIMDLLRNDQTRNLVNTVLIDQDKAGDYMSELSSYTSINILFATHQVLLACSDTVTPQGIIATVDIPSFDDWAHMPKSKNSNPLYLVLDGVSDPGNTGTLIRTAIATGVSGIIQLPGCCDIWNPKAIRSAMSASFLMPSYSMDSWDEVEQHLVQDLGVRGIWAATMMDSSDDDGDGKFRGSLPHFKVDWRQSPTALVIGSEGAGLSKQVRASLGQPQSNIRAVHVPMHPGIESLNAAVCGSVILFEYLRQCQQHQDD
eukprot:CAMPEP_0198142210 /NCGR_PEP_ID=MMETSP1443-20131203/5074_1 /TAXON_ID=186043 /ORGANISM="Entomoneis sp., Strain CCMP2396" /LENGTH=379 /DNA_ID=CAMNT_0043805179 /DNA_START=95 /DNA_END=1234 /DNA_ORIENTATION=-